MRIRRANEIAEKVGAERQFRGGVIAVHGFNTTGWWQKDLVPYLQRAGLFVTAPDYGFVRAKILLRSTQEIATKKIIEAYELQLSEPNCSRPGVIAHSLGSLSLGWALKTRVALRVSNVIVNGCILPRDFPWAYLAGPERRQVDKVLNEGGGRDIWPRVARWTPVPRAGDAGCYGFKDGGNVVIDRINPYGRHSDVHNVPHFQQIWIPFILHGEVDTAPPMPKR